MSSQSCEQARPVAPRRHAADRRDNGRSDQTAAGPELADREIGYIDATIAGSSEQARRGEAVVIVGGCDEIVRRAELVLTSWSGRRFHVGPAGSGAAQARRQPGAGTGSAALAEGLALANACGIDPAAALDVLKATPAYSAVMDTKGQKMIARDYVPQARLRST